MSHPQMLEIRLPSGSSLSLPLPVAAQLLAEATNRSSRVYLERPSYLLHMIFQVPLARLLTGHTRVRGEIHGSDHVKWDRVGAQPLGLAAVPFTIHLEGVQEPTTQGTTREELAKDMESGLSKALQLLESGETLRARTLLDGMRVAIDPLLPKPPVTDEVTRVEEDVHDGWGHTRVDASVEDLLREGAAAEAGTDNHEQVIRQLLGEDNAKGAIEMLMGALKAQGALIAQLQQGRINDLKRLHELGEWLRIEVPGVRNGMALNQILGTFALHLSRIGIEPKCPHCPGKHHN